MDSEPPIVLSGCGFLQNEKEEISSPIFLGLLLEKIISRAKERLIDHYGTWNKMTSPLSH